MNSMSKEQKEEQIKKAEEYLEPKGWAHIGNMRFVYKGVEYDLSAADLTKIDYIVKHKLFVVE